MLLKDENDDLTLDKREKIDTHFVQTNMDMSDETITQDDTLATTQSIISQRDPFRYNYMDTDSGELNASEFDSISRLNSGTNESDFGSDVFHLGTRESNPSTSKPNSSISGNHSNKAKFDTSRYSNSEGSTVSEKNEEESLEVPYESNFTGKKITVSSKNMIIGLLGGILGAIMIGVAWVLITQLFSYNSYTTVFRYVMCIMGAFTFFAAILGYRLFSRSYVTTKAAIIIFLLCGVTIVVANYFSDMVQYYNFVSKEFSTLNEFSKSYLYNDFEVQFYSFRECMEDYPIIVRYSGAVRSGLLKDILISVICTLLVFFNTYKKAEKY